MSVAIEITRLDTASGGFQRQLDRLLALSDATDAAVQTAVQEILAAVRSRGDAAVLEYTARFDRLQASSMAALELPPARLAQARAALPSDMKQALSQAAERIRL